MKEFDSDDSGKVEFKEFLRVMANKAEVAKIKEKEKEFHDAFKVIIKMNDIGFTLKLHLTLLNHYKEKHFVLSFLSTSTLSSVLDNLCQ